MKTDRSAIRTDVCMQFPARTGSYTPLGTHDAPDPCRWQVWNRRSPHLDRQEAGHEGVALLAADGRVPTRRGVHRDPGRPADGVTSFLGLCGDGKALILGGAAAPHPGGSQKRLGNARFGGII